MSVFRRGLRGLGLATVLVFSSLAAECESGGGGGGKDADTDTDTDADADGDTDVDTDTDTDTDTDPELLDFGDDCDTPFATDPLMGECVTNTISCGETVFGTNEGGSTLFSADGQFEQCSGSARDPDLDGPERVYKLNVPSGINSISVRLESCEDSWLFWYRETSECPSENELVTCGYPVRGDFRVQYDGLLAGPSGVVWFVVEGYQNDGGNFAMHIECFE